MKLTNYLLLTILCIIFLPSCIPTKGTMETAKNSPFATPFEKDQDISTSYQDAINYYTNLAQSSPLVTMNAFGMTDSGNPLHEVVLSNNGDNTPMKAIQSGKLVMMINNAIHAGEPCGIDASLMFARDIVQKQPQLLDKVTVVIIPVYNIGGSLNRGGYSRANQNGPSAYGFRGNAKNLDLNRDFIKQDSKNARTFNQLFNKWSPDVLVDNHTSNGADYQYVITLIATQKDKLETSMANYMTQEMLPALYKSMSEKRYEMTPYVFGRSSPDEGIAGFLDLPRYSSGYAALHNTFSFMPETHMFKPYKDRVYSTYDFSLSMLEFMNANATQIKEVRNTANRNVAAQEDFDLNWKIDFDKEDKLFFKGYEYRKKKSKVTGQERAYYDHDRPFEKEVPFYNTYTPTLTITKPNSYIVPQGYFDIINHLQTNGVKMSQIQDDQEMEVQVYRIGDLKYSRGPYEGHFIHRNVPVTKAKEKVKVHKGDWIIHTDQIKNRYIIETLEPQAPDSYFAWNYFDGILGQKEYFSGYVFEEIAEKLLKDNKELKREFEEKRESDEKFRESGYAQLDWIYKRSPYYEKTHKRYPVFRIE